MSGQLLLSIFSCSRSANPHMGKVLPLAPGARGKANTDGHTKTELPAICDFN